VFETACSKGWDEEALHREYFSVPDGNRRESHPFTLQLQRAGITIEVPPNKPATTALKEAGITVDVKCSDGLCGVCATPYVEGDIDHRDYVLSKEQRKRRMILCCSRAAQPGGVVVLDL